jgi:hypothetical protein
MIKLSIGRHMVAKTLVDNGASLNLIMRNTFIQMGLNLAVLTLVRDTFHSVILRQSSTPIECIDLKVSRESGDNRHREMLMFEAASFDISDNCILGRPFLLKFMMVIHTSYATMKMPDLKGIITINTDQQDALACENTLLSHVGRCGDMAAQEQAAKVVKIKGGSTPNKPSASKPPTGSTPRAPTGLKGSYVASASNQPPAD